MFSEFVPQGESGGDIWASGSFAFASPINDILEKDEFTLVELLNEDEILQEVKSLNGSLLDFITKPGTIAELVSFIIKPVQEGADDNERFKYPYVACEIICCEVSNILEVLAPPSDHSHLRLLFSILEAPAPLDVRAAGYLEKVVTVLLKHKCPAIIECINEGGLDWFRLFIRHMSNFSVMKILRRLLLPRDVALNDIDGGVWRSDPELDDSADASGNGHVYHWCCWSSNPEALNILLGQLGGETTREACMHASELLLSLIHDCSINSPLIQALLQPAAIRTLAKGFMASDGPLSYSSVASLQVLEALIALMRDCASPENPDGAETSGVRCLEELCECVPPLCERLKLEPQPNTVMTQMKSVTARLGMERLLAARTLLGLGALGMNCIEAALQSTSALEICLQLCACHPNCSMLHVSVGDLVLQVMADPKRQEMQRHLILDCHILRHLMDHAHIVEESPENQGVGCHVSPYAAHVLRMSKALAGTLDIPTDEVGAPSKNGGGIISMLEQATEVEAWKAHVEAHVSKAVNLQQAPLAGCSVPSRDMEALSFADDQDDDFAQQLEEMKSHLASLSMPSTAQDDARGSNIDVQHCLQDDFGGDEWAHFSAFEATSADIPPMDFAEFPDMPDFASFPPPPPDTFVHAVFPPESESAAASYSTSLQSLADLAASDDEVVVSPP